MINISSVGLNSVCNCKKFSKNNKFLNFRGKSPDEKPDLITPNAPANTRFTTGGAGSKIPQRQIPPPVPPAKNPYEYLMEVVLSKPAIPPLEAKYSRYISRISSRELNKTKYYDKLSDDVAALVTPDKHVILVAEDGVTDDLLTHRFTRNLRDQKYDKNGFDFTNTDVLFIDAKKILNEKHISPDAALDDQLIKGQLHRTVVFVKNYEYLLNGLISQKVDPLNYHQEMIDKGVHIVGMIDKKEYEKVKDPGAIKNPLEKGNLLFYPKNVEGMNVLKFNGLGSGETKELLKNDPNFIESVILRHPQMENLRISNAGINELVDRSSSSIKGSFPQKALDVLDIVVSSKMQTPTHHTNGKEFIITSTDVKKLFEKHPERLDSIKIKSDSVYQIAENVKTKMKDVGGNQNAKKHLGRIINSIKNPDLYNKKDLPKGYLFAGPPGTGKTLMARAVAGEAKVPFLYLSASDLVDKYIGETAKQVGKACETAKNLAEKSESKTAIIFIDEIDVIGKKRGGSDTSAAHSEVEAGMTRLFTEMDGFDKNSDVRVIFMGATNRADILDPALTRPGRFSKEIPVEAPVTPFEREEILKIHASGKSFANEAEKEQLLKQTALLTDGFSGAELEEVMKESSLIVAETPGKKVIKMPDIREAILRSSMGDISEIDNVLSDNSKTATKKHEFGHAICVDFLGNLTNKKISFLSTQPRGHALGAVHYHDVVKDNQDRRNVLSTIAIKYAGGIAEPRNGTTGHASGVSADFKSATELMNRAITKEGLGINVPQGISFDPDVATPTSQAFAKEFKEDQKLFSGAGQAIAHKIIRFHQEFIDKYHQNSELFGEEFSAMRQKWLKESGKDKQIHKLEKSIERIFQKVENTNKPFLSKVKGVFFKALKNV